MILNRVEELLVPISGVCNQGSQYVSDQSSHANLEPLLVLIVGFGVGFRRSVYVS